MKRLIAASVATAFLAASFLSGCASPAGNIAPSYVSTLAYQGVSCRQLAAEAQMISARAAQATGAQNAKVAQDAIVMTAALVVFWPAAFLIQGNGAQAAEVARLKGEMQAIEDTSRRQGCGIQFQRAPAARPAVKTAAKVRS